MGYKLFFLMVLGLILSSCDMDPFLFNTRTLDNYSLSNAVIPDSSRQLLTMQSQGKTIYGFFVKSNKQVDAVKDYTLLYFHGNKHNITEYWDRVEFFYNAGFSILIFDYEGFGKSEGTCSEEALYSDARAARSYLFSMSGIDTSKIIYYGYSLGCAAAVDLSVQYPPNKLILEAPFASGEVLIQSGTLLDIPGSYLLHGDFNNKDKIKNVHVPVAIIHGTDDKFIDINKNGAEVFKNANLPKVFIPVPGADHTNIPQKMGIPAYSDFIYNVVNWNF
jgi:pimeloyl-ACP methyl ester carboxylesterase